jgi:LPS-assembly protein
MMKTLFLFLFLGLFGIQARAQSSVIDGVLIQADSTEGYTEKNQFILRGHVQVVFQGQSLSCDQAVVDIKAKTVEAWGDVIIDDAKVHLEADRIKLNYQTNQGEIDNGFVQSGQVVVEGKKIQKVADQVYVATDAEFTSCTTCPAGWSFSGREIEAELGGYAKIKRPVFKIAGWSVLPLPWLLVPLKTDRQSGLLVPSYEYSQRGKLAITLPFFWAISRSQDLTANLTYHELLGPKWSGDYRYVLSEESHGALHGAFINDRLFNTEMENKYGTHPNVRRWYFKYFHYFDLPQDYVQRVDLINMSDLDYLKDFPGDLEDLGITSGDPSLENRVSLTKNSDVINTSVEASIYKNLLRYYPLADNSDAVHKIPEIRVRSSEIPLWDRGPSLNFDMTSTHFVRDGFSYDDLHVGADPHGSGETGRFPTPTGEPGRYQRDGTFDPTTDLLRTGHRLDMTSSLSYPFQLGRFFELNPSLTYREMQYRFQIDDGTPDFSTTAAQRYVQTDVSLLTEFSKVYGKEGAFGEKFRHSVIPQISYSHIPWIRRPHHAFFGQFEGQRFNRSLEPVSDQDLNGINKIQFDYDDRVFDRDFITFALRNQWTRKTFSGGLPVYTNLAYFELSQSYDFNEAGTSHPQPWSNVNGILSLDMTYLGMDSSTSYNGYAKITNTSTRIRIKPQPDHYFQVSYSKTLLVDENNEVQTGTETENIGLGLGMISSYWDLTAQLDYSKLTRQIQAWEYRSRFKPPGNCWYLELIHRQTLGGDANIKANVSFNFDGL